MATFHKLTGWTQELLQEIDRTRTLGLAAETAFWLFLSLVPLAAVAGVLAAKLALANWQTVVPFFSAMPPAARELLTHELANVSAWGGGTVGITGVAVFVWLASSGVHAVFDAMEIEIGVTRPWWKKRLLAITTCVALSIGVALLAFIGPGLDALEKFVGGLAIVGSSLVLAVFRAIVGLAVAFGMVAGLYWVGIPRDVKKHVPIVPGAALAVSLQITLAIGYRIYLSKSGDGGAYQAGLAVIGVTLTALYLLSAALLTGVVLNQWLGCQRGTLKKVASGTLCSATPERPKRHAPRA